MPLPWLIDEEIINPKFQPEMYDDEEDEEDYSDEDFSL